MSESVREYANRIEAIIETAIDGIITISHGGIIESFNKAAAKIFEYDQDEVIGKNIKILMPNPYRAEHQAYLENYMETRVPRIIGIGREVSGLTKSGNIFPMRLAVAEVVLNDRLIFTGIVHDMSEIKRVEDELKKANSELEEKVELRTQELEKLVNDLLQTNKKLETSEHLLTESLSHERQLNELKSRFVATASHEFRTPLTTILSSVSLISKYEKETEQNKRLKHVDRIKSAVSNLTGILNDLLSLSKIEEGKIEVNKTELDPVELCDQVFQEVAGMLKPNQELKLEIKGEKGIIVTDVRLLKNVLFNLISNAIKYSEKEIRCKLEFQGEVFITEIIDQGIGIPLADQPNLFKRFFRAKNVELIQGTGLGLCIVKSYMNLLNGDIEYKSVENKGSIFTISIPLN